MSEKTRAELKEQIKIMNHNYQTIKEMHERGYQYSVGEIKRLQDELDRTRKALDVAVDALKEIKDGKVPVSLRINMDINDALDKITALTKRGE